MNFVRNLKLGARLGATFAVVLALLLGIAVLGATSVSKIQRELKDGYENNTLPLQYIGQVNVPMMQNRILVMDTMANPEAANIERRDAELRANIEKVSRTWEAYLATKLPAEGKKLADEFLPIIGSMAWRRLSQRLCWAVSDVICNCACE